MSKRYRLSAILLKNIVPNSISSSSISPRPCSSSDTLLDDCRNVITTRRCSRWINYSSYLNYSDKVYYLDYSSTRQSAILIINRSKHSHMNFHFSWRGGEGRGRRKVIERGWRDHRRSVVPPSLSITFLLVGVCDRPPLFWTDLRPRR